MHGGSADTSLAEICPEMNELFDKQVNTQKEKTSGIHASSCKTTKKFTMKMKQRNKKKQWVPIIFLMEGRSL